MLTLFFGIYFYSHSFRAQMHHGKSKTETLSELNSVSVAADFEGKFRNGFEWHHRHVFSPVQGKQWVFVIKLLLLKFICIDSHYLVVEHFDESRSLVHW